MLGLSIQGKNIKIDPFPDKNGLFIQIKVPYQSPLMLSGSLPRIKLDLSQEETIEDDTEWHLLTHNYSDASIVSVPIQSYSLDEIFAEKCRAFVQRTRPRDLYDIVNLYERFYAKNNAPKNFNRIAQLKFEAKNLEFPRSFLQTPQEKFQETKQSWSYMLAHQLRYLEDIQVYIEKYNNICKWIRKIL